MLLRATFAMVSVFSIFTLWAIAVSADDAKRAMASEAPSLAAASADAN